MQITKNIYGLASKLPKEELYGLSDQMRRSAVSIPSNIAEGQERNSSADFVRFLNIAQGSRAELETQIMIGTDIGYFKNIETEQVINDLSELGEMINSLINSIQQIEKKQIAQILRSVIKWIVVANNRVSH